MGIGGVIKMHRRTANGLWLALCCAASGIAQGQEWSATLGATTDNVYQGISRSAGTASAVADLHYYAPSGWLAGAALTSVRQWPERQISAQLTLDLGYAWPAGDDWSMQAVVTHYAYPWSSYGGRFDYDKLSLTAAYGDQLFMSVTASPNTYFGSADGAGGKRSGVAYDLIWHRALPNMFSWQVGLGYNDLRHAVGKGYFFGSAGLGWQAGNAQFDISYIMTDAAARSLFGPAAKNHWVAGALWHF